MKSLKEKLALIWDEIDELSNPVDHVPDGKEKDVGIGHTKIVPLSKEPFELTGYNTLEDPQDHIPQKKEKDTDMMQWEQNLRKELEEAFLTPDAGITDWSNSLYFGGAVEIDGQNDRNFCPDPMPPEKLGPYKGDQDPSNTLIAKKEFIPKENKALKQQISEMLEKKRKEKLGLF